MASVGSNVPEVIVGMLQVFTEMGVPVGKIIGVGGEEMKAAHKMFGLKNRNKKLKLT